MTIRNSSPSGGVQPPDSPEEQWQISIRVPARLPVDQRHELFEAVTAAVSAWEPEDRDGWDVDVCGHRADWKREVLDLRDAIRSLNGQIDDLRRLRSCLEGIEARRG